MHCTNCGTQVADNSKFCPSCGTGLDGTVADNESTESSVDKKAEETKNATIGFMAIGLLIFGGWQMWPSGAPDDANSGGSKANSQTSSVLTGNAVQQGLQRQALEMLHDENGALCDRLFDEQLTNVTYGTLSRGGQTRFPAIHANYDYQCVHPVTGDVERKTQFWVVFGHDEIGGKLRCFKSAGRSVVDRIASDCDFQSSQ